MDTRKDTLNLGEVAASFGWSTRFVERLAVGGKLPGAEVNGQWQFRREELVDWLDQKLQTLDAGRIAELEHQLEGELESEGMLPRAHSTWITSRLQTSGVDLALPGGSKALVLRALVDLAHRTGHVLDDRHLHAALVEREVLCSTALPGGVAIVHPRRPLAAGVRDLLVCVGRTVEPVPFGAEDGQPTRLFFLLVAPDDRMHLHALARLVRLLRGPTLGALQVAPEVTTVLDVLRQREAQLETSETAVSSG